MSVKPTASITRRFANVSDPRVDRTKLHALLDSITIAMCAVICGADTWGAVEQFGHDKFAWLQTFLALPNGIPAHDTFADVFARLDPEQFERSFLSWVRAVAELTHGQIIPIDDKCLHRSHDHSLGQHAIHMVSAWASANHLVLGQVKGDDKSNEITAIPELLNLLVLQGCIVTIDAMGCHSHIADQIIATGADYMLALKGKQGHLLADVTDIFQTAPAVNFKDVMHDHAKTTDKAHGRLEIRRGWTIADPTELRYLRNLKKWPHLRTVLMVQAERRIGPITTTETRYYISSLAASAQRCLEVVRTQWSIENDVHWVLDVASREDDSRIRNGYGPQNFAVLRHLALNLLKRETSAKVGFKAKRLKAGSSTDYLLKVLTQ